MAFVQSGGELNSHAEARRRREFKKWDEVELVPPDAHGRGKFHLAPIQKILRASASLREPVITTACDGSYASAGFTNRASLRKK